MTYTVMFAGQKGGVGKTTLADELAFGLERRGKAVCFVNLDAQGGAIHAPSMPSDDYDFVVVDTPGSLTKEFRSWCQSSDMVLFPSAASTRCLAPLLRCWEIAKDAAPDVVAAVVVNGSKERTLATKDFLEFLENAGMPMAAYVPLAQAFVNAAGDMVSVYDLDPKSKASVAVEELVEFVLREAE